MRVWDIHPGHLNRDSLLGEHRVLHGVAAILSHGLKATPRIPRPGGGGPELGAAPAAPAAGGGRWPSAPTGTGRRLGCAPRPDPGPSCSSIRPRASSASSPASTATGNRGVSRCRAHRTSSGPSTSTRSWRRRSRRTPTWHAGSAACADGTPFDKLALELTTLLRAPPDPGNLRSAVQHPCAISTSAPRSRPPFARRSAGPLVSCSAAAGGKVSPICWRKRR